MPERISALSEHFRRGQYGSPGKTGVIIELVPDLKLWQLAAWPTTVDVLQAQARQLIDASETAVRKESPLNIGVRGQKGSLLRVEPLKWWLLDVTPELPDPDTGTAIDLSHSRTRLRISGESAAALLNRYIPLDLRLASRRHTRKSEEERAVPAEINNRVMSSAIHHVSVTLWETSIGYELFVPRGYAVSLLTLLCLGAEQFGYELR